MASPVLLGLVDEAAERQTTTWDVSKIGGKPDWMTSDLVETTRCSHCRHVRLLVCQIYCPLENSPYHRTLYLLVCTSATCQNLPSRWIVLRCQMLDALSKMDSLSGGNLVNSDSCLTSGFDKTSAVPMATEDWCEDEDDWGEEESGNTDFTAESSKQKKISSSEFLNAGYVCHDPSSHGEGARERDVAADLGELTIHDVEDDNPGNANTLTEQCFAEDFPTQPCSNISNLLVGSSNADPAKDETRSDSEFVSFYMSVIEEPSANEAEPLHHEKNLLKQYSKREGVDLNQLVDMCSEEGKGGKQGGEKYERTEVCHGDKMFHKFMKKISICPQQILRYSWNGKPLMIRPIASNMVSCCEACGSQRVFELQLMPALISVLKQEGSSDAVVEFGTILLYSCQNSCWAEDDTYRTEQLIIQADPDQDLFKS